MDLKKASKRWLTLGGVAAGSLLAGMVISSRLNLTPPGNAAAERGRSEEAVAAAPGAPVAVNPFVRIAEDEKKAVVNISTTKFFKHRAGGRGPGARSPFDEFYGGDESFNRFFGEVPEQNLQQKSLGSGVIVDKEGYILTNNHVVDGADDIRVTLLNGKSYDAEVRGRDPKTDLALIRIKPENGLPVAPLGDSDALQVGEWVMAIGNPFGLGHTVTVGVVSAKDRTIGAGPYDAFIQTDASINPGNSGGPLFNVRGEVVGINTAIVSAGQGIGFAIPANLAKSVLEQLREKGSVTRGWLGVQVQELTPELRESFELGERSGALVARVIEGDPAEKAGVKSGDVVVAFDGRPVRSDKDLVSIVGNTPVGRTVPLTVVRDGKELTLEVKIAKRSDEKDEAAAPGAEGEQEEGGKARIGVTVQDLTKELADRLGLDEAKGVLVSGVEPGGPADRAGVQRGDVVLTVNKKSVTSAQEFVAAVRKAGPGATVRLLLRSRGVARFVAIKPEPAK
jgi:serine protease Do